jgi:hypothetical protein
MLYLLNNSGALFGALSKYLSEGRDATLAVVRWANMAASGWRGAVWKRTQQPREEVPLPARLEQ